MQTEIIFSKKQNLKNAILIIGLPGIGLVGKIAVDYLLKHIKPEKIGEVISDSFPPSVQIKNGKIDLIKDELHSVNVAGKDFLFLSGPVQPSLDPQMGDSSEHYEFARTVLNKMRAIGVTEVYTLAGINVGEKRMSSEPKVVAAATDDATLKKWKSLGATSNRPDGLITGVAGLVLGFAKEAGLKGACLMGETNARLIYGDHGSAKTLLELLIKEFKFKVDMSKMEKEAKEIEKAFQELSKQFTEEASDSAGDKLTYVR